MKFLITKTPYVVAMVAKAGSSALAKAIIDQQYPERRPNYLGVSIESKAGWQGWALSTETPTAPVLLPVRDVLERFRSACAQSRMTERVDEVLHDLETGGPWASHYHFTRTSAYTENHGRLCKLYRFPEDVSELAVAAGLLPDLPQVNVVDRVKPDLTEEQSSRVLAYYSKDSELWDLAITSGVEYLAPEVAVEPEPIPEPVVVPEMIESWRGKCALALGGYETQVMAFLEALPEPNRTVALYAWNSNAVWLRQSPMIAATAAALAWDDARVDALFVQAASFTV